MNFVNSLKSEWLKTRRSAASWLCLAGGLFMPFIFLTGLLVKHRTLNDYGITETAWKTFTLQQWELMSVLLLPLGIVLAGTLMTQVEYKNNTWKQLHTTPQTYSTIFFAKLAAIVFMTVLFFILFQLGIILSGFIPSLVFKKTLPGQPLPWRFFWNINRHMFIGCLPVIALQFLLSLQLKNFIIPVGIGIMMVIASVILVKTTAYAWLCPYTYTILFLSGDANKLAKVNLDLISTAYFILISIAAYVLYKSRKEKG
ncbi:MAG: ABC transporter permease [Chitinophagaceae bacterium]|jgi:hypothetical protein